MKNIAIDLGGTSVRVAVVEGSQILNIISEPCKSNGSDVEVIEHISSLLSQLMQDDIDAIGIGVPAVVDVEKGIVYDVVAIPSWKEVHLKYILEERFRLPVYINNDCNCFAVGVSKYGEAKGYDSAVCVTLGTGVGGSLIINGILYNGHNTGAGEIGSIPYLDKDYEYYCSSRFFLGKGTTGKEASIRASNKEQKFIDLWNEFGGHIGKLVALIVFAYDPQIIVFGGSIAKTFDFFKDSMYEQLKSFPYQKSLSRLKIISSEIENMGIIGASAICEQ